MCVIYIYKCVPLSSDHEMDCLREETVSVPGRSGAQSSVASTRQQQFKEGVCWVWGVQSDFSSPFAHSGWVQFLESGEGCTNDSLSSPDYPPYSIRRSDDLVAELNHSYWCDTRSDSHNCPFSCPFKRTRSQRLSEDFTLILCAKISLPHISGLYHDGRWTNSVTT